MQALATCTINAHVARQLFHHTEYYILDVQNGKQWANDDAVIDAKLEAFRNKNGGKPPNLVYIPIDDIGSGYAPCITLIMHQLNGIDILAYTPQNEDQAS